MYICTYVCTYVQAQSSVSNIHFYVLCWYTELTIIALTSTYNNKYKCQKKPRSPKNWRKIYERFIM